MSTFGNLWQLTQVTWSVNGPGDVIYKEVQLKLKSQETFETSQNKQKESRPAALSVVSSADLKCGVLVK